MIQHLLEKFYISSSFFLAVCVFFLQLPARPVVTLYIMAASRHCDIRSSGRAVSPLFSSVHFNGYRGRRQAIPYTTHEKKLIQQGKKYNQSLQLSPLLPLQTLHQTILHT